MKKSHFINVVSSESAKNFRSELDPCVEEFHNSVHNSEDFKTSTGYFDQGQWQSLLCNNQVTYFSSMKQCLKNKVIYFVGDSTIRQFFYLVALKLKLQIDGPDNSVIWQQPKVAYSTWNQGFNTTIYYRAHGPPLQNPGPPETRPYISDSIRDLPLGGDGVYVIFNIGAHLVNYNPNIFLHRLKWIRYAIVEHHSKFPGTKFIVRGLNVVEMDFEWLLYRYEILLRAVFADMDNVVFLNLFDIGTVWPLKDYHPESRTLDQQTLLMLSYMCS